MIRTLRAAAVGVALTAWACVGAPVCGAAARAATATGNRPAQPTRHGDAAFVRLGNEFLDHMLSTRPQLATRLGIHTWDRVLIPVTQVSLDTERAWFQGFQQRLAAVPRASLTFEHGLERDLLVARTDRELLDLDVIRPWETNPNSYLDLVAGSIQSLLQRNFASPCRRLEAVSARLRQVPEVLRAARINLSNPPRIATEVAIAQFPGVLRLYREEVAAVATGCREPRVEADLAEADTLAVRAVTEFIGYLRDDLLPRSTGTFAIGRDAYQRKLLDDEMESTPVDTLLAQGWKSLEATRARMEQVTERIAPGRSVAAELDSLAADHPDAGRLVPYVAADLDTIRAFLRAHKLITMPVHENLRVRETPVFRRSLTFASMEAPGVWERRANEAYYNITPADPSWTPQQQSDHLGFFNRWNAPIVSVHEALPGHYYQVLELRRMTSRLRQFLGSGANTEGWAHYCEQMMVEQGFGGGDPRVELAQLDLALQRLGRFVVGLSLHTQGMTYDDAVKVFEDRCWMSPVNAAREARRGTLDPTYLVYTLGKWRILELREELRQRMGQRFDLRRFHDAFLKQGNSALPVVRAALLHDLDLKDAHH